MPSTYSIWNSTTIILVDGNFDGNFNMVRGNFRHLDRSAAFTNTDSFNIIERTTVTRQSLLSTTSLGKFLTCFEGPKALIHIDQHQLSRDLLILLLNVPIVIMIATAWDTQAFQVILIIEKQVLVAYGLVLVDQKRFQVVNK